jgi:hypothetical protein
MANMVIGGLRWVKTRRGANSEPVELRPVASAYATGIFRGDPLKLVSDGTVAVAAAGESVYAVADGAMQYRNGAGQVVAGTFLPAATTYTGAPHVSNPQASVVRCTPVMGQVFEGSCNTLAATVTVAQGQMGNNAELAAGAGGSTTTGRSSFVIDNSTTGTATMQVRLLEISSAGDNDVTAVNWLALVEFNEGSEPSASNPVGV